MTKAKTKNKSITIEVINPDQDKYKKLVGGISDAANDMQITNQTELQQASDFLSEVKAEFKDIEEQRHFLVDPMNLHVTAINKKFKPWKDKLLLSEKTVKLRIVEYDKEVQRKLRLEQAKQQEGTRTARDKIETRAGKLREQGKVEQANALDDNAASMVAVQDEEQEVTGITRRKRWVGRITDMKLFCGLIASGDLPETLIKVNPADLNRLAQTYQNTRTFDGFVIEQDSEIATR